MKKQFKYEGQQVTGQEIEFQPDREPFSVYFLADGTRLKLKVVLTKVHRLDTVNAQGQPVYDWNYTLVTDWDFPPQVIEG